MNSKSVIFQIDYFNQNPLYKSEMIWEKKEGSNVSYKRIKLNRIILVVLKKIL